jgi:hypothetical protein
MDRKTIVRDLIELRRPLNATILDLKQFPWDCEAPLVALEERHFASVLCRYRDNELNSSDVEMWASAIELRDDIDYDPDSAAGRLLHELANPLLTLPLTSVRAAELLEFISQKSL